MPEQKKPKNFGDMLKAIDKSMIEDADAAFSLPEAELDKFFAEEGVDPANAIERVQKLVAAARAAAAGAKTNPGDSPARKLFVGHKRRFWTHRSVIGLNAEDPIQYICTRASEVVLEAMQVGWQGPPFDPAKLAEYRGIKLVPKADVPDARIIPSEESGYQIEFNPTKNRARVRFSLAHELAHSLFEDCSETIRNRLSRDEQEKDDWQLEMLCNLAAAEFLMPIGHFPQLKDAEISINKILDLRREFEVSTEAVLLRLVRLTETPCAVFAASERKQSGYQLEYAVSSRSWPVVIPSGVQLPRDTHLRECSAVGYTSVGEEEWLPEIGPAEVQCVRISPYPGESVPRFVGLVRPKSASVAKIGQMKFVKGDVTQLRGSGRRVLAHIVNDKTPNWGAGVGRAVQVKWPETHEAFKSWVLKTPRALSLGNVFHSDILDEQVSVFQMICQHGYAQTGKTLVRYAPLKQCLEQLADFAERSKAAIHMPKIGTGYGGGSWQLIQQMIDEVLCSKGLNVTIYEFPGQGANRQSAPTLFD